MEQQEQQGVTIPPATVEASKEKKRKGRTLRQMPVWRDLANLKYLVVKMQSKAPRKLTKFFDQMLMTVSEAKKCVGMANANREKESVAEWLDFARVLTEDVHDDITILRQLNQIDRDTEQKMKSLAKGITAQCAALRDYTRGQGVS